MQYLGIDWGKKRIGLAIGNDEVSLASPFGIVRNLKEIVNIIKEERIEAVIIGVPFSISDVNHTLSSEFKLFLENLKNVCVNLNGGESFPVIEIDERLSSKAGDALVGSKKTKASRDSIAAMIILQSYFDSLISS